MRTFTLALLGVAMASASAFAQYPIPYNSGLARPSSSSSYSPSAAVLRPTYNTSPYSTNYGGTTYSTNSYSGTTYSTNTYNGTSYSTNNYHAPAYQTNNYYGATNATYNYYGQHNVTINQYGPGNVTVTEVANKERDTMKGLKLLLVGLGLMAAGPSFAQDPYRPTYRTVTYPSTYYGTSTYQGPSYTTNNYNAPAYQTNNYYGNSNATYNYYGNHNVTINQYGPGNVTVNRYHPGASSSTYDPYMPPSAIAVQEALKRWETTTGRPTGR